MKVQGAAVFKLSHVGSLGATLLTGLLEQLQFVEDLMAMLPCSRVCCPRQISRKLQDPLFGAFEKQRSWVTSQKNRLAVE